MRDLIYYVASSIDGFIAGPEDHVGNFIYQGTAVDNYLEELKSFDTVIMGRKTYEFGYKFGAVLGQPSPTYQHMDHYIFSDTLRFQTQHEKVHVKKMDIGEVRKLKESAGSPIYVCGGGMLAGWILEHGLLDILKIKLNPLLLGRGTPLFGDCQKEFKTELLDSEAFENGLQTITYKINYGAADPG